MAGRQRKKGIQHDLPHDPRNTRKPLAASAPDAETTEDISNIYSASYEEVYHNSNQRGRLSLPYNRHHIPSSSSHSLRNSEITRIRDSGYNTDVSPARTSSSTSTPAEHFSFSFDYPERMTIREDSSVGSPFSDGGFMSEGHSDHHDGSEHHQHLHHLGESGGQFSHPPHHLPRSSPCSSTRVPITTSTSVGTVFSLEPVSASGYSDSRMSRRQSNSLVEDDAEKEVKDNDLALRLRQQRNICSALSQSAPGSHNYEDLGFGGIQQSPSLPVGLCQEMGNIDIAADDDEDTVDGGRHGSSYSRGYGNASSTGEGLGVPLLPKSMSNSFRDLEDGDEIDPEEDDDNDVMTSSEERDVEEMALNSRSRRCSLRKRHYSGPDEEEFVSSLSVTATSTTVYQFSPREDEISSGVGSDISVQLPCSTSLPSLSRDYSDQMSPELASSIKTACQYMIGMNFGTSTDQEEEAEGSVAGASRRLSMDKAPPYNSGDGFYLREEEELYVEGDRFDFDALDSFHIGGIDDNDSDEDVFTFDFDDIQQYKKSQESLDRDLGAHSHPSHQSHSPTLHSAFEDHQDGVRRHPHPLLLQQQQQLQLHSAPATPKAPAAVPPRIVLERPPISPSSRTGGRKSGRNSGGGGKSSAVTGRQGRSIPAHVQLAGGARLPWDESSGLGGVVSTTSTQTPHRTSTMIDEIVTTPLALPNEARGTAFMHLRRGSVDMTALLRNQTVPLPDIVPRVRHRAQSAPNLHDVILRQRAQRTGRELRRLSDLFHQNVVRRHSVHQEESQGERQSSSYPRMGPSYFLREGVRALVFGTFRSRRDSSVDDDSFPEVNDADS